MNHCFGMSNTRRMRLICTCGTCLSVCVVRISLIYHTDTSWHSVCITLWQRHGMVSRCRRAFEGTQLNRSQFCQTFDSPNRRSCIQRSYLLPSTTDTRKERPFSFLLLNFLVFLHIRAYDDCTRISLDAVSTSYAIILLLDSSAV